MAKLVVGDFVDLATGSNHDATSYQVAKDKDFTLIVDESIKDYINVKEWATMLPKRPEDGPGYYKAETELWARIQIHLGNTSSNWYVIGPKNQRFQQIVITEDNQPDIETDSDDINLHFTK